MRSIINRVWLIVLVTVAVCGVAVYIHEEYFFNPLTFRNNNVVYLPLNWYKNPMQIQVWGKSTSSSPQLLYTTFNKNQIRWVFRELERGQVVDNSKLNMVGFTYVHITIRSGSSPDSSIVQDALVFGPSYDVAQIGTQVPGRAFSEYITVSPTLKKWALSSLQEGKPIH